MAWTSARLTRRIRGDSPPEVADVVIQARSDWRDTLVGAGLGDEDWRRRLDDMLGHA